MKRLITFICLIVIIIVGCLMIKKGFENNFFNIASYNTIETKSEALTKKLAAYDKKNKDEYDTAVTNLKTSVKQYKDAKAEYDAILSELEGVLQTSEDASMNQTIEEIIYSDKEKYKVDFLLVTLGNYGEKEGVDVFYQLTTSATTDTNATSLNYFLADLKFTITGQYMDVTNFISDLENDDKLNWEIREFAMASGTANGYSGVSAKFTVRDVPIDSESYLASASAAPETPTTDGSAANTNTTANTTANAVVFNTVSNTTTNTTTNTVSNTVN